MESHPERFIRPARRAGWAALLATALSGCAADAPVPIRVAARVEMPQKSVLLFFVDGLGAADFDAALDAGRLPNIRRHLVERGTRVRRAVAAVPTITYANAVTFLTGMLPGHHGINSNRWFDPSRKQARDYTTIATYRAVDDDYNATTIHDLLGPEQSGCLQAAQRRGADYAIDNYITAGVNWGFGNYVGVDCLVAQNMVEVAERADKRGRWPSFLEAYFPGVDHVGHHHGTKSAEYARALDNLDRQVGRMCDSLRDVGMYERTTLVFVADHGLADVVPGRILDIGAALRANSSRRSESVAAIHRQKIDPDSCDAVWAASGTRHGAIHLRTEGDWSRREFAPCGESDLIDEFARGPGGDLLNHAAIAVAAGRHAPDAVWLRNARGCGVAQRRGPAGQREYRYDTTGGDPLGYRADTTLAAFVDAGWHDSRHWLTATAGVEFPDAVPQVVEMFDSPRAGDIVLFAAEGWDFSTDEPGAAHGSILAADLRVPMLFAGPDIPHGEIAVARNCDIMPTLIDLLGVRDRLHNPPALDGISLRQQIARGATPAPCEGNVESVPVE